VRQLIAGAPAFGGAKVGKKLESWKRPEASPFEIKLGSVALRVAKPFAMAKMQLLIR
jgi:hypothetical protein